MCFAVLRYQKWSSRHPKLGKYISSSFFSSKDYKTLINNKAKLNDLLKKGAYVSKGDNKQNIEQMIKIGKFFNFIMGL